MMFMKLMVANIEIYKPVFWFQKKRKMEWNKKGLYKFKWIFIFSLVMDSYFYIYFHLFDAIIDFFKNYHKQIWNNSNFIRKNICFY